MKKKKFHDWGSLRLNYGFFHGFFLSCVCSEPRFGCCRDCLVGCRRRMKSSSSDGNCSNERMEFLVCIWFISHFLLLSLIDDYRIGSFLLWVIFFSKRAVRTMSKITIFKQQIINAREYDYMKKCVMRSNGIRWRIRVRRRQRAFCFTAEVFSCLLSRFLWRSRLKITLFYTTHSTVNNDNGWNCSHSWILNWFSTAAREPTRKKKRAPHGPTTMMMLANKVWRKKAIWWKSLQANLKIYFLLISLALE